MNYYNIAGYIIEFSDIVKDVLCDRFDAFTCPVAEPNISFKATVEPLESLYQIPDGAEKLVDGYVHMTYRHGGSIHFFQTPDDVVTYVRINDDYSECVLNLEPKYNDVPEFRELITTAVMFDIRKILTGRLALDRGLCIHSCVINYNGNGILFSAVSETGKTTHAHLWQEVFPGTEIINGDNGFCRVLDGVPYVFGSPWCGDSNEYMNKSVPIKAIVFLEQAEENSIERLCALDAFMRFSARCYMPLWDKDLVAKAMDTVEYITHEVDCFLLKCLPDRDAVKVAEHGIFKNR